MQYNEQCKTNVKHIITLLIITSQRKNFGKAGKALKNSGKGIIINNFLQSLNSSHFLKKQPNRQILSY